MNLEEIKKLYEECEQNVDALAFENGYSRSRVIGTGRK